MSKSTKLSVSANKNKPTTTEITAIQIAQHGKYSQHFQQYISQSLQIIASSIVATSTPDAIEGLLIENQNNMNKLTIGQLGFGDGLALLQTCFEYTQHKQQNPDIPQLHLCVFETQSTNSKQLQQRWHELSVLDKSHPYFAIAEQFLRAELAAISGCQRIELTEYAITIDVTFGDVLEQVKNQSTPANQLIHHWHALPHTTEASAVNQYFNSATLWHLGRISLPTAGFALDLNKLESPHDLILKRLDQCGFNVERLNDKQPSAQIDELAITERKALTQQVLQQHAYNPLPSNDSQQTIAIIGGGIAAACLALSLAERGKNVIIYCKDDKIADGASGNKQGAIYPLLTPENSPLSQFFQQAFLYSRRRIQALTDDGYTISHQWCGVLQTGFDDKTQTRLDKIINGQPWPAEIAYAVNSTQASSLAGVEIGKAGFYYPLGGWCSPFEFAHALIDKANTLAKVSVKLNCMVSEIIESEKGWKIFSPQQDKALSIHKQVVIASGAELTTFKQTNKLQLTGFRGQVSHIPSQGELSKLQTVLCANGYLTPQDNQQHCVGASYVKDPAHLNFCPIEQQENHAKMQQSFPNSNWVNDIDVSNNVARIGIRMVSRDHFPFMGCVPNVQEILARYTVQQAKNDKPSQWKTYWQTKPAPIFEGLFVLGGFGSRGLSSAPLVAETLAANICSEISPLSLETQALISPNRMWLRKLLKGKALM